MRVTQDERGEKMKYLRIDEVVERVGLSKSTLWRLERANEFPARRQISRGAVGWLDEEVEAWMRSRPNGSGEVV